MDSVESKSELPPPTHTHTQTNGAGVSTVNGGYRVIKQQRSVELGGEVVGGPLGLGNVEGTGWLWVGSNSSPVKHPRDTE